MSDLQRPYVEMNEEEKAAERDEHAVWVHIGELRCALEHPSSPHTAAEVLEELREIANRPDMNEQIVRGRFRTDVGNGTPWQDRVDAVAKQL